MHVQYTQQTVDNIATDDVYVYVCERKLLTQTQKAAVHCRIKIESNDNFQRELSLHFTCFEKYLKLWKNRKIIRRWDLAAYLLCFKLYCLLLLKLNEFKLKLHSNSVQCACTSGIRRVISCCCWRSSGNVSNAHYLFLLQEIPATKITDASRTR